MAAPVRGPTPTFAPIADVKGYVSVPWQQWFGQLNAATLPDGVTGIVDGSVPTTGNPTVIFQDFIANQPLAEKQYLFFSLDTGDIFTVASNGSWQRQTPQFTGDVLKMAFSNVTTLSPTGVVEGTYENATVTVDSKGRITSIEAGTPDEPFVWPVQELGDLIVGYAPGLVKTLPVGNTGQVLTVTGNISTGIEWVSPTGGNEVSFSYLDAVDDPNINPPFFICTAPFGYLIERIEVIIVEPFDSPTTLDVGVSSEFGIDPTVYTSLMDANYFDTTVIGSYETSLAYVIDDPTATKTSVVIQIVSAVQGTTGRGVVRITLSSIAVVSP